MPRISPRSRRCEECEIRVEIVGVGIDLTEEVEGDRVTGVRERLAALYGPTAALALERREAGESVATLRIPRE
jgi:glucose-6-phosphate-specific signal transduction histidine kinase